MKRKNLFILIVILAVIIVSILAASKNPNWFAAKEESPIILYTGDGCPHCAKVEEFIKENQIESKISFSQKEVYYNQFNARDLQSKAKICGLPIDAIGVPFLWDRDNTKCLIGDVDIINFFQEKIK